MANEFVARRGIIAQSGGAKITGSLLVSGTIDATGYNIIATSLTGSFSGSIGTATTASYVLPSGLPAGTVSASSQVDYNSIQNKLSGVISSSAQFNALSGTSASFATTASFALNATISAGTVSSSTQFKTLTDPFTGSFTGSFTGDGSGLTGIATSLGITGSTGTATVNLKTQGLTINGGNGITTNATGQSITVSAPAGTVSASSQIDYNSIQNKLSGVVSSSAQVQPLLPGGTVSSSAQYPGWVTASSQIDGTLIQNKTVTVGSTAIALGGTATTITGLTSLSATSITASVSGALTGTFPYNSLTSIPSGIVSSSAQVAPLLPGGTVSSSAQYPGWVTASSQIDYNSIQNKLSGVVSSSAQVQPLLPGGTVSSSAQYPGWVTASSQIVVQNTTGIAALATTGSNVFTANQVITGSLFISQNLTVLGSSSISYISQSTLNIGTNKITVNTDSPGVRFGGLDVIDSGSSPQRSGSLYFDSINDQWIFVHQQAAGAGITSSIVLMGPATFNNVGNETLITQNRILKGAGLEHITDSQITDNGITVSITNGLSVGTNLTASQADITTLRATSISASVSGALTGTFPYNSLTSIPSGIVSSSAQVTTLLPTNTVSSSAQVTAFLPGGTVSSSAQYPGWVTASSQIQLASITGTTFAASNFTFPQQLTVSGVLSGSTSAYLNNTLYSGSAVTGIVGPVSNQVVASLPTGSFNSAFFDYNINDGTNYRAGTVMSVWSPGSIEFTETSTADLGNTSQATFTVDILTGVARLRFSNTSGTWTVKTAVRAL